MATLIDLFIQILFPLLLLGTAGYLLLDRNFVAAKRLIGTMLFMLTILSTPFVSNKLMIWLESLPMRGTTYVMPAQAIVVLGAGVAVAEEFGGYSVGTITLQRVRYGASLARQFKLPLLMTGGNPDNRPYSEAWYMKKVMVEEFGLPVQWIEEESNTTIENAQYSATLLKKNNIHSIFLVTEACHMMRARLAFEMSGINVIPASTAFIGSTRPSTWNSFIPNAKSLDHTSRFLHEVIGIAVYKMKTFPLKETLNKSFAL